MVGSCAYLGYVCFNKLYEKFFNISVNSAQRRRAELEHRRRRIIERRAVQRRQLTDEYSNLLVQRRQLTDECSNLLVQRRQLADERQLAAQRLTEARELVQRLNKALKISV
jgi:predicted  nucleic acid-binding Zn-ribbon protein